MIDGKIMGTFEALLGHVIDLEFDTHEAMIEAALHWQIEEYQFDEGVFKGSMKAIHTSHLQLGNTSRTNGVFIKGYTPNNTYTFALVESEGKISHNGSRVHLDELVVLNENDQLDFVVSSSETDITISIDKDYFDTAFENYFNEPFQYDSVNKRIQLKENSRLKFTTSLKNILIDLMRQNKKILNDTAFHNKAEENILQVIFQNIELSKQRKKILESEINANKVRSHIEMNYTKDIAISELCSIYNLSERTLRLSFKNLFGLSPKQYHKYYALGKVHHAFLKGDTSSDTVERIAYDHGFSHMGRLSSDYKSMFGNTPSHTLRKSLIS